MKSMTTTLPGVCEGIIFRSQEIIQRSCSSLAWLLYRTSKGHSAAIGQHADFAPPTDEMRSARVSRPSGGSRSLAEATPPVSSWRRWPVRFRFPSRISSNIGPYPRHANAPIPTIRTTKPTISVRLGARRRLRRIDRKAPKTKLRTVGNRLNARNVAKNSRLITT